MSAPGEGRRPTGIGRQSWLVAVLAVLFAGDAIRFTVGWVAFGVLAVAVGVVAALLLFADRQRWSIRTLPYPLLATLAYLTASLAWSAYPGATALGLTTTWLITIAALALAISVSRTELLVGLARVLGAILVVSLVFELVVATVIRGPVAPFFGQPGVDYSQYDSVPLLLLWSRDELFSIFAGGRIQGILGNANNLGMIALLAVIVFVIAGVDRVIRRRWAVAGVAVAVVTLVATRSATVTLAGVGVLVVAGAVLALRTTRGRARAATAIGLVGGAGALVVLGAVFREPLLGLLGKESDLTGRVDIWAAVLRLAQERPVFGWGWVSYWVPWAAPFDTLAFRDDVRQLQAHSAWVDLALQGGVVGIVLVTLLVGATLLRSWILAVERPRHQLAVGEPYRAATLMPLLVLVALLVQSIAESRLLVEYGWALVVAFAVSLKRHDERLEPVAGSASRA